MSVFVFVVVLGRKKKSSPQNLDERARGEPSCSHSLAGARTLPRVSLFLSVARERGAFFLCSILSLSPSLCVSARGRARGSEQESERIKTQQKKRVKED